MSSAIVLALFLVGRTAGQVVTSLEPRRFLTSFTDAHLVLALPFVVLVASGAASTWSSPARCCSGSPCPPGVEASRCGELTLRGKEARVAAWGLTRAPI